MKSPKLSLLSIMMLMTQGISVYAFDHKQAIAIACPFDKTLSCTLERDILNDVTQDGLHYYASTNYDHRMSGEIELYNSNYVVPYTDCVNAPGQLKLLLNNVGGKYTAGEIMTRINLNQAPYNSPVASAPWTTSELKHGYLEVIVKMPKCETSDDALCQMGKNPANYNQGLWPAIWLMPSNDSNWPMNGETDLSEAYLIGSNYTLTTATLHFNGNDPSCGGNDCVYNGYSLAKTNLTSPLYKDFHTWGYEWQPDPASTNGGYIMTGYLDGVKIWGPMQTDNLPGDGKNAYSRGFNDPNGGYYLIVNLAIGGGYAGAPNSHLLTASMLIQSIKAYDVSSSVTPPPPPPPPPPPTTQTYNYNVYVGYPFNAVIINKTITCPNPVTHAPVCLVTNQAQGSTMTITGASNHLCNLVIKENGSIVIGAQSANCNINSIPATTTTPGTINLPSGF